MAVYAAAIAAVAGAVQSSNEKKMQKIEIQNRIDAVNAQEKARRGSIDSALRGDFLGEFGLDDIFGRKAEGINPPEVDESLTKNISQIRNQGLPAALEFTSDINQQFSDETVTLNLERINRLNPQFGTQTDLIQDNTTAALRGELPFDDVLGIVSDRSSLAASLGTPGGSFNATLKDLGIARLTQQQAGFGMFQQFAQTLQSSISPTPRFARGDEILPFTSLSAGQRVEGELATTEARQRAELINALADPAAAALFGEEFQFQQDAAQTRAGTRVGGSVGADAFVAGASAFDVEKYQKQQKEYQKQQKDKQTAASASGSSSTAGKT